MHTKASVRLRILNDYSVAEKALYTVFLGQTNDEVTHGDVRYRNNRGFSRETKFWGTWLGRIMYERVQQVGGNLNHAPWGIIIYSPHLQDKVRQIALHHAGQVANVWNEMNTKKFAA